MKSRRDFLKYATAVGAGALLQGRLPAFGAQNGATGLKPLAAPLRPFIDPLKIPPVLRPSPGQTLQIAMSAFKQKLHSDLPPTSLWGFQGVYPGPTIEVQSGGRQAVQWTSRLPTKHFLQIDNTIHGAEDPTPEVRTVVHLHGAKVLPESDGHPEAWFTSDGHSGPTFQPGPYIYPNDQPSTMLWYHDHAIGITRLNVYAGLAGMYIIRDANERSLNLPSGEYEIPLMIQDRLFNEDGSLLYPTINHTHPHWIPEVFGDSVLVNGVVLPYLEVEPRRYRLRMLNASNSRFYHMKFAEADANGTPTGKPNLLVHQIGSDGGLLPWPVPLLDILAAPAERFDVIVDFSGLEGRNVVITNDNDVPTDGDEPPFVAPGQVAFPPAIMLFKVTKALRAPDRTSLPNRLANVPVFYPPHTTPRRWLTITEKTVEDGFPIVGMLDGKMFHDPVSETPRAGEYEVWNLLNATIDAHPVHIHLVQFRIMDRQYYNPELYARTGEVSFIEGSLPTANERDARKDTVMTFPGTVTRVIARFDLPRGTPLIPGKAHRYVWHCNILEHEDNVMMRPFDVIT